MASQPDQHPSGDADWPAFFDDFYADLCLTDVEPGHSDQIAQKIIELLQLNPGDCLLDQCCGVGRLSIPLAQRGLHIIGVDFIERYIQRARDRAAKHHHPCEFHCANAGDFIAPKPCDAAINWFTSFGYSMEDNKNRALLHRAFESLKPGGRFLLDRKNMTRAAAMNVPSRQVTRSTPKGEVTVITEDTFDLDRRADDSTWTFILPDGTRFQRKARLRIYHADELRAMLEDAGFIDVKLLSSVDGIPFDVETSVRCVVLGRKPRH